MQTATLPLLAALALPGCGDDTGGGDATATAGTTTTAGGESETGSLPDPSLYDGPASAALGATTNQARCSTCHSNDGTQDGYSGNTFKDIAFRAGFKGGDADLLGGINACITGWMGGEALAEGDTRYLGLRAYLESISDPSVTATNAISPEVLADEAAYEAAYAGGDAAAGAAKYNQACAVCHDNALIVGAIAAYPKASLAGFSIGRIAQKVRTAGPPPSGTNDDADSTPGPMPFFEEKDLSAADLRDIIAHLKG